MKTPNQADVIASAALILGLAVLAAIWLGPLPALSQTAFSPSMITHLGVVAGAAPLLGLGLARMALEPGLPTRGMSWALAASLLEWAVVWGWHLPGPHEAAARSQGVFAAQQLSYLGSGVAVWFLAFAGRDRATAAGGMLACFMSFMHMTLLGLLFVLAPAALYNADICRGAFSLSPLEDQQFGGMLMIGWGSLVYLVGGIERAWRFIAAPDRPNVPIVTADDSADSSPA